MALWLVPFCVGIAVGVTLSALCAVAWLTYVLWPFWRSVSEELDGMRNVR
jgi:hypothetical protein